MLIRNTLIVTSADSEGHELGSGYCLKLGPVPGPLDALEQPESTLTFSEEDLETLGLTIEHLSRDTIIDCICESHLGGVVGRHDAHIHLLRDERKYMPIGNRPLSSTGPLRLLNLTKQSQWNKLFPRVVAPSYNITLRLTEEQFEECTRLPSNTVFRVKLEPR